MSKFLSQPPYSEKNEQLFIEKMVALTKHHLSGCQQYKRVWPEWKGAENIEELPFLHVGIFKLMNLKTESENLVHERHARSSSTSGVSSFIVLDQKSSELQANSMQAILGDFLGETKKPLLIIDSVKSLYNNRKGMSARIAAALSLKSLSTEIHFLLDNPDDPNSLNIERFECLLKNNEELMVYGFSWILWLALGSKEFSGKMADLLNKKRIDFIHSGGWKKLESIKVNRETFDGCLLHKVAPGSKVIDFYGMVEQMGVVYPLCEYGYRHVPVWADIIVRDPRTMRSLVGEVGQLQLLNTLAFGAPYHNVLSEDLGLIEPGVCRCGRSGKKFKLLGRVPKAELRGCSNV